MKLLIEASESGMYIANIVNLSWQSSQSLASPFNKKQISVTISEFMTYLRSFKQNMRQDIVHS